MQYIPKQSHYVRCPALKLLRNKLYDFQMKTFGDPCTKQKTTRCLFRKTAERMFCDIQTERIYSRFWKDTLELGSRNSFELKKAFKKLYNNCRQPYKQSRKNFLTCSSCKCEFSKKIYTFVKWRQTYVFLLFQIKPNLKNLLCLA